MPNTVFFGTGPVAARCLELLLGHTSVEAVVTKPRSHRRDTAPVLDIANQHNLPVVEVANKAELDEAIAAANFTSRYATLIDFGIIVSQRVIDSFEYGIINSHFSLLPSLRGADPISFAILEGHNKTGVSLMLVDKGMDTGKLIAQRSLKLGGSETTPSLTKKLIILSDELLQEYIPRYLDGIVTPRQQPHPDRATYSRKLSKADGVIDWTKPAPIIEREIRAFAGWPGSRTSLAGIDVTVTSAHIENREKTTEPGTVYATTKTLAVETGENSLTIDSLKPAGKKEMPVAAFLSGYKSKL